MNEETFKKAEWIRTQIRNYKQKIKDSEHLIKNDFTVITFQNADVMYNNVNFSEDKAFVNTAIKTALICFKEKLSELEKELEGL